MCDQNLKCILHADQHSKEPVKQFDSESWQQIQKAAKLRLNKYSSSKYYKICEYVRTLDAIELSYGYHTVCYKNFTAIQKEINEPKSNASVLLRSKLPGIASTSSGVFENVCIFCKAVSKRAGKNRETLGRCESFDAEEKIKSAAKTLCDQELQAQICDVDFISKEVKYHHSCRRIYLKKAENISINHGTSMEHSDNSKENLTSNAHETAFQTLSLYVEQEIIATNGAEYLTSLHKQYVTLLDSESKYSAQKVEAKLLNKYKNEIKSTKSSNRKGKVIYSSSLSEEDALLYAEAQAKSNSACVVEAALILRQEIIRTRDESKDLSLPLSAEVLGKGNGQPSCDLMRFFRTLYTGSPRPKDPPSLKAERCVRSSADDVLYNTSNGTIKPGKHLNLALGLKSITGSRKVIEILNHFGHCVGYHMTEMLETEMATHVSQSDSPLPDGLLHSPGLHTGTAWDNYDENTETLSGAGTLHDTVGICYQDIPTAPIAPEGVQTHQSFKPGARKRSFQGEHSYIRPYMKKPRIQRFEYPFPKGEEITNYVKFRHMDMLWMMGYSWNQQTPMWIGWNARWSEDCLPQQRIGYMKNITEPPTQLNVVARTLTISQEVAKACGENVALATYDLAVAKLALQIQAQEKPIYDNVFICFGAFHISMTFFACLGHLLDGSGGPYHLTETGVLAGGSLKGFINGRHFNRCKRLHPILALAFWKLHFQSFLEKHPGIVDDAMKQLLSELGVNPTSESVKLALEQNDILRVIDTYDVYSEETRRGAHGKTAQFWIIYIDLVNLYLMFSRACRTCDFNLFVYCLGRMCPTFFAMNRPNYSRWMTLYHLNLLNIDITHPGAKDMLENGGLSIKRTPNSFSRVPVDMALEQTVNADAASRMTGISSFIQSESARTRWMITRSLRSAVVSSLLEMAGLDRKDETSHAQRLSRVERDQKDVDKLSNAIENSLNPFSEACPNSSLYCISSGKAVPDEIANDLLSVQQKGEEWYKQFKDGCFSDPRRFEKPIPRRKVKNFAAGAVKLSCTAKDKKVKELKCTSDLFGRLLYLATTSNINLQEVFRYPLTPVPLCFAHIDGSLNKTDKSKLLSCLEKKVEDHSQTVTLDVCIVDGMFFIQSLKNVPLLYKDIARTMLIGLCRMAKRVELVCDTYKSPSIKDIERQMPGLTEFDAIVTGPLQIRPKEFHQALRSSSFKSSLLRFLVEEWAKDEYNSILTGHELYVAIDSVCYVFTAYSEQVVRSLVSHLQSGHEEADTRLIFHACSTSSDLESPRISVRASDTDVLVLLLHHLKRMNGSQVWMDIGNSSNNTRRYIDVNTVALAIGEDICDALPSFHAFTGCDYTAAFARKGKCRPLHILESSDTFQQAFSSLGSQDQITEEIVNVMERFVCRMYSKADLSDVNTARFCIFKDKYAPRSKSGPLDKVKGCDPCAFPPSKSVLLQKLHRVHYVSSIWKNAHTARPALRSPEEHGWKLVDGSYSVIWYSGDQMPSSIHRKLDTFSSVDSGEDEDEDEYSNLSDGDTDSESNDSDVQ